MTYQSEILTGRKSETTSKAKPHEVFARDSARKSSSRRRVRSAFVRGAPAVASRKKTQTGKLILIRHGHTSLNLAGEQERLRGWLDIPLDEQGLREAEQTAARLTAYGITAIYSSDLTRAIQTSVSVSRSTRAPLIPAGDLRPWNLGSFAGQLVSELIPFLDLLKSRPELPAPGGESWNQFYDRYSKRLLSLMALAADSGQTIAAVTHVRNFLAAPTVIHGGDRNKIAVRGGPKTGSAFIIERIDGKWSLTADE
ncbi:MAG TPA: histidine phosphatase family protein [Verrucomicrobiae bacterium]|jgi:broad specificity phosphatase PhoE|nr:histidine phosphatase family protein [Verrucomicrobiae bacterium]